MSFDIPIAQTTGLIRAPAEYVAQVTSHREVVLKALQLSWPNGFADAKLDRAVMLVEQFMREQGGSNPRMDEPEHLKSRAVGADLAGKRNVNIRLTASGIAANPVQITIH